MKQQLEPDGKQDGNPGIIKQIIRPEKRKSEPPVRPPIPPERALIVVPESKEEK